MQFELLSPENTARLEAVTNIDNATWDWCPWIPSDFAHSLNSFPNDKLIQCYVQLEDGVVTAQTTVMEAFWLATPGQTQMGVSALDKDTSRYRRSVEYGLGCLRKLGFSRFMIAAPSKEEGYCQVLADLGFSLTMRQKVSQVDIGGFALDLVPSPDYEIMSFPEYERRNPETFRHDLWMLIQEVLKDVPMPEPYEEEPYEDWCREYFKPGLDIEARMFAVVDGKPVGLSEIGPNKVNPKLGLTGLTGVLRPYRRRGIARQLKIASILKAREKGICELYTDNEENNPMYLLNVELGFRHVWDICIHTLND